MDSDEIRYNQQKFMGLIGNKVINEVGKFDGKKPPNKEGNYKTVSLASHLIDTTLIGINSYLYDLDKNDIDLDEELLDVLICGLVLHDVDKVVTHKTDTIYNSTTEDVLEIYFEYDWFGIEEFLREYSDNPVDDYFDILYYLIKRTEKRDSITNLPSIPHKYKQLSRYTELGDSVTSVMTNNNDIKDGYTVLKNNYYMKDDDLHMVRLHQGNRPMIHNLILSSLDELINKKFGIVLGYTIEGIIYLGDEFNNVDVVDELNNIIKKKIADTYEFDCKINWQTLNYNELPMIDIPIELKKDIIRETYKHNLMEEKAGTDAIEHIPEEFMDALPEILHRMYELKDYDFTDEGLQDLYSELDEELHGSKIKIHLINNVLYEYDTYGSVFIDECLDYRKEFEDAIQSDFNPIVDILKETLGLEFTESSVSGAGNTCYMCGCEAELKYQGEVIYNANSFSKRASFKQKYRRICSTCMMEHALVKSVINQRDTYTDDIIMVYFWFDSFSGSTGFEEVSDTQNALILDSDIGIGEEEDGIGSLTLKNQLVHINPVSLDCNNESKKNKKLRLVKNILEKIESTGMKARISTPFNSYNLGKEVFVDNAPIKEQEEINITKIEYYEDLQKPLDLLQLGNMLHGATNESYPYQYIIPDTHENLIHNANKKFDKDVFNINPYLSYAEQYNEDTMTNMNTVARKGIALYGYEYQSKYAQTKVFRESLDALIDAKSKQLSRDKIIEIVSGQAMRSAETQSEYVSSEQAEEFTIAILDYIDDAQYNTLNELANNKNVITDTYKFSYMNEMNKSD